MQIKHYIWEP